MRVLVTGAAGYIGSHACRALLQAGATSVVGVDTLDRGHAEAVSALRDLGGPRFQFFASDVRHTGELVLAMSKGRPEAVLHFAGLAQVAESVAHPHRYWSVNWGGTASVLDAMRKSNVRRLVFSSSAAVYGPSSGAAIQEDDLTLPVNPYGHSKLAAERLIGERVEAAAAQDPLSATLLRYFNVAGAASDGSLGEDHRPETHLIPSALQVALGVRDHLQIFGTDYDTPDGTCIRDYVHVDDLVRAHLRALAAMPERGCRAYNIGIGRGFSVREVLAVCRRVSGHAIPAVECPRRAGDPPSLVADVRRAHRELSWSAEHRSLDAMVQSAWDWMRAHPRGYETPA
ncbi:MAG: UDP-glucose 4-epimerase GalE [Phycisphaerae bacterium]|nr:UDP-glucose 4-epimerase GalE [Phycisphaerae bacterium]